jgi:hypothetical protein
MSSPEGSIDFDLVGPLDGIDLDSVDENEPDGEVSPVARESIDEIFSGDFLESYEEEKERIDIEIDELAALDELGWYHKLYSPNSADPKTIKKMMLVINAHGSVCQSCHIDFEIFDPSLDFSVERTDTDFMTITAKQNDNFVATIVTSICESEQPVTLINFPCAIDFSTMRVDVPRRRYDSYLFDTCVSKLYTNNLFSKTTGNNLDKILKKMVKEKFAYENQQSFTSYAGLGQTYIKKQSKMLLKTFQVRSDEPSCGSVDLYIYDNIGTHKYTIMAPPKIPKNSPDTYEESNESKYNPRVLNSFQELSDYYDNGIINASISMLKQSMAFFQINSDVGDVRFCTSSLPDILKFMNSFRIFGCQSQQYIVDFSCFSASHKNYTKETLDSARREKLDIILKGVSNSAKDVYGGKRNYETKSKRNRKRTRKRNTRRLRK